MINAYQVEKYNDGSSIHFNENYQPQFEPGSLVTMKVYGTISEGTELALSEHETSCNYLRGVSSQDEGGIWKHQGSDPGVSLIVVKPFPPLWLSIIIITICISISSLFNGLCLGLLALDVTELKVIANSGTEKEKNNARKILPVRQKGNELLCSILLTSTFSNAIFTVLVDLYVDGWVAVIISTLIIVIFIEVVPCAVVSRYGILIGGKTIWLTKAVMFITFPLSFTLGRTLDRILGQEISMYTKDRIKELIKITSVYTKMEKQEVDIISGALELSSKCVKDIMTPLQDVYMLPLEGNFGFETIADIMKSGYSRIPIYEDTKSNIVSLIFTKDLAILDPEDKTEIKLVVDFYRNECLYIHEDTTLNNLFNIFKDGQRGHMAFVYSSELMINNKRCYETIGLVTLEDVLEEMIQSEIVDETDTVEDNRSKKKRERKRYVTQYLSLFSEEIDNKNVYIPPQLRMAALQFLSAAVEPFHQNFIRLNELRKILRNSSIYYITSKGLKATPNIIFPKESLGPHFILILEGRVRVIMKREKIKFEAGSFTYFGTPALTEDSEYFYDYTVEAIGEVKYLVVTRSSYLAARQATESDIKTSSQNLEDEYHDLFTDSVVSNSAEE